MALHLEAVLLAQERRVQFFDGHHFTAIAATASAQIHCNIQPENIIPTIQFPNSMPLPWRMDWRSRLPVWTAFWTTAAPGPQRSDSCERDVLKRDNPDLYFPPNPMFKCWLMRKFIKEKNGDGAGDAWNERVSIEPTVIGRGPIGWACPSEGGHGVGFQHRLWA